MKKRRYKKSLRAENEEQTRTRIIEAAMTLHEKLGPASTSIKAIAEQAGVQRLTVYRHFQDEASLFQACTAHWLAGHPPPAVEEWSGITDTLRKRLAAFSSLYRYYRETQKMWHASYRDAEKVAALRKPMSDFEKYLDSIRDELTGPPGSKPGGKESIRITVRHALRFSTWQSLNREKLSDNEMAELVTSWLQSL